MQNNKLCVIVPCYKVKAHIERVIAAIPDKVERIYCVDDACPEGSGDFIRSAVNDQRVSVIQHAHNKGVGGAMITGYRAAQVDGMDIAVKIDGDGQMDPRLIDRFVQPIISGEADYVKGNRFYFPDNVQGMPVLRMFGNAALSFFCKLSSGYWDIFDPANGYTALHLSLLDDLQIEKVSPGYFFESDMLFRLNINRCVVRDVPMPAVYGSEISHLSIPAVAIPFLSGHSKNTLKRIFYTYFLRDFQVASLELLLGPAALLAGLFLGMTYWAESIRSQIPATAGTVMIPGLLVITGLQLTLAALAYDMHNIPRIPAHRFKTR
jgi:dolichol-phosphate mannosyltransferase